VRLKPPLGSPLLVEGKRRILIFGSLPLLSKGVFLRMPLRTKMVSQAAHSG